MKKLYATQAMAVGGRNGQVVSLDGALEVDVRIPKELGGPGGKFTNPEQLFAAGYAACFDSALNHVARLQKIPVTESRVVGEVGLLQLPQGGFQLSVELQVEVKGIDQPTAEKLLAAAHQVCPYSNATRNNIDVKLEINALV